MPPSGAAGEARPDRERTAMAKKSAKVAKKAAAKPILLSGGNPHIAKGDGDTPVQA